MKTKLILCFLIVTGFANAQWQNINTLPNPAISFITCNNNLFAGLAGGGVYRSQDRGNSWEAVNNGIQMGGAYVFSLISRNDSLYAGGFGEVYFSKDYGSNWVSLNLNLDLNDKVFTLILKDNYLFAGIGNGSNNGVYRKQLNDSVWSEVSNGLPANTKINAFAVLDNILFAGTDSGVYSSRNYGADWTSANNGISSGIPVKSLFTVNGNILAGTPNGVFVTSDTGNSWSTSGGLGANSNITCFTSNTHYIVAGAYDCSYYSSDNGGTWSKIKNEIDSIVSFYSLTTLGNFFYAGTGHGIELSNSVFRFAYSTLTDTENNLASDNSWFVYPNPVVLSATIHINSSVKNAELDIYSLFGQKIQTIKNISGPDITFKRDKLPCGMYFIRLSKGNRILYSDKIVIADN